MKLPKEMQEWVMNNYPSANVNNSRSIVLKDLEFLYTKFQKSKNEFWARQIEDKYGFSYDYSNLDPLG